MKKSTSTTKSTTTRKSTRKATPDIVKDTAAIVADTPEIVTNDDPHTPWYHGGETVIDVLTSNAATDPTYTEKTVATKAAGLVTMYTDKIQLAAPTKSINSIVVHDKALIDIISNVRTADRLTKIGSLVIAKEISKISEEQATQCGFAGDTIKFAHALFDYSNTTISLYRSVAKAFINDDYSLKEEVSDFRGIGYLIELLPILSVPNCDITTITDLLAAGTISENMSTSSLRKAVKDWKNSKVITAESAAESDSADSADSAESPALSPEKCIQALALYADNNPDIIQHLKAIADIIGINF